MAITFELKKEGNPSVLYSSEVGVSGQPDPNPNEIDPTEANQIVTKLRSEGRLPPASEHGSHYVTVGPVRKTIAELLTLSPAAATATALVATPSPATIDPREPLFEQIRTIFGNDTLFNEWKPYAISLGLSVAQLQAFKKALEEVKSILGADDFRTLLSRVFAGDKDNIITRQLRYVSKGRSANTSEDAFHGFVVVETTPDRLKRTVWDHGNDYGEGGIGAPYVDCSKIMRRISPTRVLQQIVIDLPPLPGVGDKMTLNDTTLTRWGGAGWSVDWTLQKDAMMKWECLTCTRVDLPLLGLTKVVPTCNDEGTTMHANVGHWRFLPLGPSKSLVWYATHSEVIGFDPPDDQAIGAVKGNIAAFTKAAQGHFGN